MPTDKPLNAYAVWAMALDTSDGLVVKRATRTGAYSLKNTLYQSRMRDRKRNLEIYKDHPNHPLYGKSQFDPLSITITEAADGWELHIIPAFASAILSEDILDRATMKPVNPPEPREDIPLDTTPLGFDDDDQD